MLKLLLTVIKIFPVYVYVLAVRDSSQCVAAYVPYLPGTLSDLQIEGK